MVLAEAQEAKTKIMIAEQAQDIARIAQELERQHNTKKDYVVSTKTMAAVLNDENVAMDVNLGNMSAGLPVRFNLRNIAHENISEKLGITLPYYRRMRTEAPSLLVENINYWLGEDNRNFMLRTLDGHIRALLSDRFRTLDNWDLFFNTYERVKRVGAQVVRIDLTEDRFYMRCIHPDWAERLDKQFAQLRAEDTIEGELRGHQFRTEYKWDDGGEWVIPGVTVSNSEVGRGGLMAEPFIKFASCWNLAITERAFRKYHIGRQQELGEFASTETRELEDRTVWSAVGDLIDKTFDRDAFQKMVGRLEGLADQRLEEPMEAVDAVVKDYGLTDEDRQSILNELLAPKTRDLDPGITAYGLLQAVTAQAKRHEDYNEGIKFERIGGELMMARIR